MIRIGRFYYWRRLPEPGIPGGVTVSKRPDLPAGDFRLTEYTWPEAGLTLWFIDDDDFTESERLEAAGGAFAVRLNTGE